VLLSIPSTVHKHHWSLLTHAYPVHNFDIYSPASKIDIFLREFIKARRRHLQSVTWHRLRIIPTWTVFQYTIRQEIMTDEEMDNQSPIRNRLRIFRLTSATRLPLRPTHLPIRWVKRAPSLAFKCTECEGDLSSLSENESTYLDCDVWNRIIIYEEIYLNLVL